MNSRLSRIAASFLGGLALSACSGGGSSSAPTPSALPPICTKGLAAKSRPPQNPIKVLGGSVTTCATAANPTASTCANNQMPLVIGDTTATYYDINSPQTSVKICAPGSTTNCAIIDSILVDTGSSGLRLFPSAFSSAGSTLASNGLPGVTVFGQTGTLYECQGFLSGNAFGPVGKADLYFGGTNYTGEMVSGVSVHVMDPSGANGSSICPNPISASQFNFNGIMGVGLAVQDCGSFCAVGANNADVYFNCTGGSSGTCTNIGVPTNKQVTNPIALLATDNNGVSMSFPAATVCSGDGETPLVAGTLTLGIDTQTNNSTSALNLYPADQFGNFTTVYNGATYGSAGATDGSGNPTTLAFIDSGSNGLFFTDKIAQCGSNLQGFYCPAGREALSGVIKGATGSAAATVNFDVADNTNALNAGDYALLNLGGSFNNPTGFDWGLPFFYGRTVFVGFVNKSAHSGAWTGPYWAF